MILLLNLNEDWKNIILVVTIIIAAIVLSKLTRWVISKSFISASEKLKVDPTKYKFFKNAVSLIIWIIALGAIVSLIPKLKALAITLFAGAGIFIAILGFAAQQAFSNIVGGIFIVIFKPFRVGDMIKVGTLDYGVVEDITLRHTVIINFENKQIIIPNSVISSETILNDNIGDTKVCQWIKIGIDYTSDIRKAISIIQEVAMNHPNCIDVRSSEEKEKGVPQVIVKVLEFGESSINMRAEVWTNDPYTVKQLQSDILIEVKDKFDEVGIEIPFPHRTVVYKKEKNQDEQ